MKKTLFVGIVACLAMGMLVNVSYGNCGGCGKGGAAAPISAGAGYSEETDSAKAGAEAAKQAKAALGKEKPQLVLVFGGGKKFDHAKMLEAVTAEFDPSIVFGCSAYNTVTPAGYEGTVSVLAIGGHVHVTAAVADVEGKKHDECGKKIGEGLKAAAGAKEPGKLCILIGDCHIPANKKLVTGVASVLGADFPIIGAAAMGGMTYDKGKCVGKGKNLGILITGDFTIGCSMRNKPVEATGTKGEQAVATAGDAFKEAIGKDKDKLMVAFSFNCGGRRGTMVKEKMLGKELETIKSCIGKTPMIGFYGSGEMGCKEGKFIGEGYHISACVLKKK